MLSIEVFGKYFVVFDWVIDMYVFNLCKKLFEWLDGKVWIKILCGCGYLMV